MVDNTALKVLIVIIFPVLSSRQSFITDQTVTNRGEGKLVREVSGQFIIIRLTSRAAIDHVTENNILA